MPTATVRNIVVVASLIALLVQPSARGQATQPADLPPLSAAVSKFLEVWLVGGDARGAVGSALAPGTFDERFVPAEFYRADDYRARMAAVNGFSPTLARDQAVDRLSQMLAVWRGPVKEKPVSLGSTLAPVGETAIPELWSGLRSLDVPPVMLPGIEALTYPLTRPQVYEWIATATVGYRSVLPGLVSSGLRAQGVVCRIRTPGLSKPWMLFMFWGRAAASPGAPTGAWTLRGVTAVPTE